MTRKMDRRKKWAKTVTIHYNYIHSDPSAFPVALNLTLYKKRLVLCILLGFAPSSWPQKFWTCVGSHPSRDHIYKEVCVL